MNITYLIGNGFDINIGLNSRYADFYRYYVKQLPENEADVVKRFKEGINTYIKNETQKEDLDTIDWRDLEVALGQFSQRTQSSVFLPQSIIKAIRKLDVFTYEKQNVSEDTSPLTVLSAQSDKINNNADTLDGKDTFIPKQSLSVVQFIDAYFGVKEAIIEWYKDNGIDTTNLNL